MLRTQTRNQQMRQFSEDEVHQIVKASLAVQMGVENAANLQSQRLGFLGFFLVGLFTAPVLLLAIAFFAAEYGNGTITIYNHYMVLRSIQIIQIN